MIQGHQVQCLRAEACTPGLQSLTQNQNVNVWAQACAQLVANARSNLFHTKVRRYMLSVPALLTSDAFEHLLTLESKAEASTLEWAARLWQGKLRTFMAFAAAVHSCGGLLLAFELLLVHVLEHQ
jgi:hypothetical protein